MYFKLVKPNKGTDSTTIQCLDIMFSGFVFVSSRMFKDNIEGGKHDTPPMSLISASTSIPTTNAGAEFEFGMLDKVKN